MKSTTKDIEKYIKNYISQLLTAHGLDVADHKEWVTIAGSFPTFRGTYYPPEKINAVGSFTIQIMLDEKSLIEEHFAAIGDTNTEAVNGALDQFSISMLHPILAACCGYIAEEQVTKEIWPIGLFSNAKVWSGNIAMRMSDDVAIQTPTNWLTVISNSVKKSKIKKGYNWISLYYSRLNSDNPSASASLNNIAWPIGHNATTKLKWPSSHGFYGARLFILLVRK